MALVYLGIGSNLGDKEANISNAIEKIKNRVGKVLNVSSFYYSKPVGFESKNNFVNVVLSLSTELTPQLLLKELQEIEKKMGRVKPTHVRYADRIIDIDILTFDNLVIQEPNLEIPHPQMTRRNFVLIPLFEINPNFIFLKENKSIKEFISKEDLLKIGYPTSNFQIKTKRYCQTLDLRDDPKLIEMYKKRHTKEEIWQEVLDGIRQVGILEMEIYLSGTKLFMIVETPIDFNWDTAFETLNKLPRQQEWEEYMSIFQQSDPNATSNEKWTLMERIFHLYD